MHVLRVPRLHALVPETAHLQSSQYRTQSQCPWTEFRRMFVLCEPPAGLEWPCDLGYQVAVCSVPCFARCSVESCRRARVCVDGVCFSRNAQALQLLLRAQRARQRARRVGTLRQAGVCFVPGVDQDSLRPVRILLRVHLLDTDF